MESLLLKVDEPKQTSQHISTPVPGRIRLHGLRPQHSRVDYARRKSAADISSRVNESSSHSHENNDDDDDDDDLGYYNHRERDSDGIKHGSASSSSSSWIKRRFTLNSTKLPQDQQSFSDLLRQKRPSIISQMMESFVRRLSSRKKKHRHERQEDPQVIDPVYETLKIAAETRKRTLATYLQQRQQMLNKQSSLNSQGSSEPDTQASPRVIRNPNAVLEPSPRVPTKTNTRVESEKTITTPAAGKRTSLVHFSHVVEDHQLIRQRTINDPMFY